MIRVTILLNIWFIDNRIWMENKQICMVAKIWNMRIKMMREC